MNKKLFRKSALDHLASPEQLDKLLIVTRPRSWIILIALLSLLGALTFWGVTGKIQITTPATGMLLRGGDVQVIVAPVSGNLVSYSVEPGDIVAQGQELAIITTGEESEIAPVISPFYGRVLRLMAEPGNFVAVSAPLLAIELSDQPMEAVLYISHADSLKVKPGMHVQIHPVVANPEEYGYLIGTVTAVEQYASSSQAIGRLLGNQERAAELVASGQSLRVNIALAEVEDNPSGYAWSVSNGPPLTLQSGTTVTARIVSAEVSPFSLIFLSQ